MSIVETERFILRPFQVQDIDFLDELHGDEKVMRYILGRTRTHDENIAYLERLLELEEEHGVGQRIVLLKENNKPVGRCGISFFYAVNENDLPSYYTDPKTLPQGVEAKRVIELGYTFLRQAWGKGYATEAAAAMQEYGLNQQNFPRIHSIMVQENVGSIGVAEKIGAKRLRECLCLSLPGWDYISERKNKEIT